MTKSKTSVLAAAILIAVVGTVYLEAVLLFHTKLSDFLRLIRVMLIFASMFSLSIVVFHKAESFAAGCFYAIVLAAAAAFVFDLFLSHGTVLYGILFKDRKDTFMDFFNCIIHVNGGDPYSLGCIYPPLAYIVFGLFYILTPTAMRTESAFALRSSQLGMMEFFFFSLIVVLLLATVLYSLRAHSWRGMFFSAFTLFSPIFVFAFERGNIVTLAFVLTAMFFLFKDSNNVLVRHCAFICLALAAGIKVYPAIFGFVLILEKRWKDSAICVLYGLLAFFLPFLFFGGFSQVGVLMENIFNFSARSGYHYRVELSNTFEFFLVRVFGMGDMGEKLSAAAAAVIVLLCGATAFFQNERWKSVCAFALLTAIAPGTSYIYSLVFMAIPLAMFLSKKDFRRIDIVYAALFAMLFVPVRFMNDSLYYENTLVTLTCVLERVGAAAIALVLTFDATINLLIKKVGRTI
ncbi:MAG: glycosyltransferase family 87 protein [Clostridia bacterium]|nr:glycosyltransferase family 87 protein [Clostridia bacterium]